MLLEKVEVASTRAEGGGGGGSRGGGFFDLSEEISQQRLGRSM